eukprot:3916249-Prymnesium_polylepis.1
MPRMQQRAEQRPPTCGRGVALTVVRKACASSVDVCRATQRRRATVPTKAHSLMPHVPTALSSSSSAHTCTAVAKYSCGRAARKPCTSR